MSAHNPTGMDPTHEEWQQIAKVMSVSIILTVVSLITTVALEMMTDSESDVG